MELMKTLCHCLPQNESCSQPIKQAVTVYQWNLLKETSGFQTILWPIHTKKIHLKISSGKEKSRNAIVSAYTVSFEKYYKE